MIRSDSNAPLSSKNELMRLNTSALDTLNKLTVDDIVFSISPLLNGQNLEPLRTALGKCSQSYFGWRATVFPSTLYSPPRPFSKSKRMFRVWMQLGIFLASTQMYRLKDVPCGSVNTYIITFPQGKSTGVFTQNMYHDWIMSQFHLLVRHGVD